jgi:hypothetical protein
MQSYWKDLTFITGRKTIRQVINLLPETHHDAGYLSRRRWMPWNSASVKKQFPA